MRSECLLAAFKPVVHVVAPEVVYYGLLWILRLILSRNMRREKKEVSASCKSHHNSLASKTRRKANTSLAEKTNVEVSCTC
jgi:hypothetical protein